MCRQNEESAPRDRGNGAKEAARRFGYLAALLVDFAFMRRKAPAARTAAAAGRKTAVIEGGERVGGLCILRGCMPSKTLPYAAEVLHRAQRDGSSG